MVLSLGFIIAFIGAAVALLIGILIFSEVEDAIICPAGGGGGDLISTLNETSDANGDISNFAIPDWIGQILSTSGEQISSVRIENIDNTAGSDGTLVSQIYTGATTSVALSTLVANSSNFYNMTPGGSDPDIDFTWTFSPAVTVSDANTFIAIVGEGMDSEVLFPSSTTDIGPGIARQDPGTGFRALTSGNFNCDSANCVDILMQVTSVGGGGSGQGSDECENAKDTAWTVIGILPVALFFALFAIFGSLGRQN